MAYPVTAIASIWRPTWSVRSFREHARDVHDAGELLALADREMVAPLDREARRFITRAAKRVATVTAMSPMALIAVTYVAVEHLRLLRRARGRRVGGGARPRRYPLRAGSGGTDRQRLERRVLRAITICPGAWLWPSKQRSGCRGRSKNRRWHN